MYCRKCGDLLKKTGKKFECDRGNMELSAYMTEHLYASFVTKSEDPGECSFEAASGYRFGGNYFCPGCGSAMREESPGAVRGPFVEEILANTASSL
jgi:hypothetical protein